jgi:hypothetical protein
MEFDPILFLGSNKTTTDSARFIIDFLYDPIVDFQSNQETIIRFFSTLIRGLVFRWGVMVCILFKWLNDKTRNQIITFVLIAWLIVDSKGSVLS